MLWSKIFNHSKYVRTPNTAVTGWPMTSTKWTHFFFASNLPHGQVAGCIELFCDLHINPTFLKILCSIHLFHSYILKISQESSSVLGSDVHKMIFQTYQNSIHLLYSISKSLSIQIWIITRCNNKCSINVNNYFCSLILGEIHLILH